MKPASFLTAFVLALSIAAQSNAQIKLPLDASNCAILNALAPGSSAECADTADLGVARGLIVRMNNLQPAPSMPQTVVVNRNTTVVKRPKSPRIDYKAAKSESGYYIHFAFDSETLGQDYKDHLDRLAIVLNSDAMKKNCIKISGHTDTVGDAQYNLALSRRRATSVYNYLVAIDNIDKDRFTTIGLGESQPLPDKSGISPYNRRVEFSSKTVETSCKPQS